MNAHLSDEDRAELSRILRDVVEADRPFSPKMKRWKELLLKIDPAPELVLMPYPPPKSAGQPSYLLAKKRRR